MSRSGYNYDIENDWDVIRYRGAVASAIRGKRGQKLLRDLLAALDAMPEKRLITLELEDGGEVCALGALGRERKLDMSKIDPFETDRVALQFDVAEALVREIVWENDEAIGERSEKPEARWHRMRGWVAAQIHD